jgi:primosomal protein N' (replication factor Y)
LETFFIDVIVPLSIPNKYTYRVPTALNNELTIGKRVIVQFGKSKLYTGIIYKIHNQAPANYEAKYIESVLDEEPVVLEQQLMFWDWLAFYYCANPGDILNAALPSGLKLSSQSTIQINPAFNLEEMDYNFLTQREHQLIEALGVNPNLSFDDVVKVLSIKSIQPIIASLLKKSVIQIFEEVKEKYKPKLVIYLQLNPSYASDAAIKSLLEKFGTKSFKQAEALLAFLAIIRARKGLTSEWIVKSEVVAKSGNACINALIKKEIFLEHLIEEGRLVFEKESKEIAKLSETQADVLREIYNGFHLKKPVVLNGVTGSGKTEIYIHLINEYIGRGSQVLYLIPEIALTTQLITRLRAVFGEQVGVYHSKFSENERVEIWNNVLQFGSSCNKTDYKIILGARSSLFLPFSKLGLIIVDEEHDNSFKQYDPSPRYHGRDAALYLAAQHRANVLLGSATPSLETIYQIKNKKYIEVKLNTQHVKGGGTEVIVCDTNFYENSQQMKACLTAPLFNAIESALLAKKQVILFQNRRGYAPYTECKDCAHVPQCVQCDVSLIFHKQSNKLTCHYCGYTTTPPTVCNACGSNNLVFKGLGTEKIEEDISLLFPTATVARMDLDSTRSKYAYKQLLDDFESGKTSILIGTQMVTKGLDFKNVSVVGVLNADSALNFPDFRSFEKAFQLFVQVRGRAGRGSEKGQVYIQTNQPKHEVIKYVINNELELFYESIMDQRKAFFYPPFSRLIEISLQSKDLNELNHLSELLAQYLKTEFKEHVLGPEFPMIKKIKNNYIKRILLKVNRNESALKTREIMFGKLNDLKSNFKNWNYRVSINVDPV